MTKPKVKPARELLALLGLAAFLGSSVPSASQTPPPPANGSVRASAKQQEPALSDAAPSIRQVRPLESAESCARYIAEVRETVPPERATTRHLLEGLKAALFVNDYLAATQVSGQTNLEPSNAALMRAFAEVSADRNLIVNYLRTYSSRSDTLASHYGRLHRQSDTAAQITAIEAALRKSGATVNTNSDLLLDCMRLACFSTQVDAVYGQSKKPPDADPPTLSERTACLQAFGRVFNYRFINRHGLKAETAAALASRLTQLRIDKFSPADLEYPAVLR